MFKNRFLHFLLIAFILLLTAGEGTFLCLCKLSQINTTHNDSEYCCPPIESNNLIENNNLSETGVPSSQVQAANLIQSSKNKNSACQCWEIPITLHLDGNWTQYNNFYPKIYLVLLSQFSTSRYEYQIPIKISAACASIVHSKLQLHHSIQTIFLLI